MDVEFADDELDRLEIDASVTMGLSAGLVRQYRKLINMIRSAPDERDFYEMKSCCFEKLKGDRQHQQSMRLNRQFRLVVELHGVGRDKKVRIVGVEDYH